MKNKLLISIISIFMGVIMMTGCSKSDKGNLNDIKVKNGDQIAIINIENYGEIKIKLFPDAAPVGVSNFVRLAEEGFYNGKNIHRVIENFMMQGGSLNGDGTGGESADGGTFSVETSDDAFHFYGALAYANAGGKNTCQFYIVNAATPIPEKMLESFDIPSEAKTKYAEVGGTPSLDGGYTVFGQTYEGFDVIDEIAKVEKSDRFVGNGFENSLPVSEIIIESITIKTISEDGESDETSDESESSKDSETSAE